LDDMIGCILSEWVLVFIIRGENVDLCEESLVEENLASMNNLTSSNHITGDCVVNMCFNMDVLGSTTIPTWELSENLDDSVSARSLQTSQVRQS